MTASSSIAIRCEHCGAGVQARSGVTEYACSYCGHRFLAPSIDGSGEDSPSGRRRAVWAVYVVLSLLEFLGAGLAACIVYPKWESELLMWISFAGVPGILAAIIRQLYRFFIRRHF